MVKIGGGLIILAAFGIMLPAVFQYVAGLARMVILIVVALAAAYLLNLMLARQAVERMRKKAQTASASDGENSVSNANGNNGSGDGSANETTDNG